MRTTDANAYVTAQGDVLDRICFNRYGTEQGTVELALAANPGLAARGAILPPGLTIILPPLPERQARRAQAVRLWD